MPLDIEFGAVCNREVDFLVGDLGEQIGYLGIGVFRPLQVGVNCRQSLQHVGMAAARHHLDRTPDDVPEVFRLSGAELVNKVHVDRVVRMPEIKVLATRVRDRETRGSHVGLARIEVRHDFRNVVHGLDDEFYAEVLSKFPHQVELGTRGPFRTLDVGNGAVARDDA